MATVETLERIFLLGATELADPDPSASPADALAMYEAAHPALRYCTLGEPRDEGGRLIFEVQRPAATTKGAGQRRPSRALQAEIDAWAEEAAARQRYLADPAIVNAARSVLLQRLRGPAGKPEMVDPSAVPMC